MTPNSYLPVLVPGIIVLLVVSVAAALALAWTKEPQAQQIVRRVWLGVSVLVVLGVAVFWISTAMVQGPRGGTVDRNLQQQQQNELQRRTQGGGH